MTPLEPELPRFLQALQSRSLFGGYQPTLHTGLPDLGWLFGDGMGGQLMGGLAMSQVAGWLSQQGALPGPFLPTGQNLVDQAEARRQQLQQMRAMQQAMGTDQAQLQRTLRGAYQLVQPGPLSIDQERLVGNVAAGAVQAMPYLAPLMPSTVDQLFGVRGSASLFAMGVGQGGRLLADERGVTGALSGARLGGMADEIFKDLYGPGARVRELRGFGGASAGQLFGEMTQRGLLSETELYHGEGANRTFHSSSVARKLKEMTGVVSAMRDLFGDMGRADAPMAELINGIEALTQGGLAKMDRSRLERMVRETQQIAKLTGVAIDNVFTMQAGVGQMAQGLGLDRSFTPGVVQGSLAFATAFGQTSGSSPGWKKFGKEEMLAYDQRLRLQAGASQLANQAGAILRLGDQGVLQQGSEAYKLYERIKSGDDSAINYTAPGDFIKLLEKSGVSQGGASSALMDTVANQEYGQRYGLTDLVRRRQRTTDVEPFFQAGLGSGALSVLSGKLGEREANALAGDLSDVMTKKLFQLRPDILASSEKRNQALALDMFQSLSAAQKQKLGTDTQEQLRVLREVAATSWGVLDSTAQSTLGVAAINMVEANRPETLERARQLQQQAATRATMSQALSGLGQQGPLRRLVEEVGKGTDLKELAKVFLGGTDKIQLLDALKPELENLSKKQQTYYKMADELNALDADKRLTPKEKEAKRQDIQKKMSLIQTEMADIVQGTQAMTGEETVEDMVKRLGVSRDELLRGQTDAGVALDKKDVALAQRQAGLEERMRAHGISPQAAAKARSKRMEELMDLAKPDRKSMLQKIDATKEELFELSQKQGMFAGKKLEELSPEEVDQLLKKARAGELGAKGLEATKKLGSDVLDKLRAADIQLEDYRQAVEKEKKLEESKAITLSGDLTLHDGRAVVRGRGVFDPGSARGSGRGATA